MRMDSRILVKILALLLDLVANRLSTCFLNLGGNSLLTQFLVREQEILVKVKLGK